MANALIVDYACTSAHKAQGRDSPNRVTEDDIYLEPTAAFRAVQLAGRDVGETLAITESTLRKRLHEKRLLASVDEARQTLTVRRNMCGSSRRVLHLLRSTILPEMSDADEDAE